MPEGILAILLGLGAFLAYLFGRWQGEHQLLYQQRLEVIDELFGRFEDVYQQFSALFAPFGGGDPQDAQRAAETFNALQAYYRRRSIWLPLRASNQVSDFLTRYRGPFNEFASEVISQGRRPGRVEKWNAVWRAFEKDAPELQQTLETEFRAAYGSWRAKLAILLEYLPASRQKN
jgi:hypothetical protein